MPKIKQIMNFTTNPDNTVTIDVEGIIGYEEWWSTEDKSVTKEKMKSELKKIANIGKSTEITVNINSYGGDVNHGMSIHDLLAKHDGKVTTNVYGHTASAATIIAQAGDVRNMSANALYLIHQAQSYAGGTAADMDDTAKVLRTINDQLADVYAKRSGRDKSDIVEVMNRCSGLGEWLTADEAKALGLIDEIEEPFAAAASAASMPTPEILAKSKLPPIPENKIYSPEETQNADEEKGVINMPEWLKKMLNVSDDDKKEIVAAIENAEKLDAAKADFEAKIKERDEQIEALKIENEKAVEVLNKKIEKLTADAVKVSDEKEEVEEKLEKVTATSKIKDNADEAAPKSTTKAEAFKKIIKDLMNDHGIDYDDAAVRARRENKELFDDMVKEANK